MKARTMEEAWVAITNAVAAEAVGDNAAEWRNEKDRNLPRESYRAQLQRGTGKAIDEPGQCHTLHPCTTQGR